MVPILSFLPSIPLCQSTNRPGSVQCHSLSDHHGLGFLDIPGPLWSCPSCQRPWGRSTGQIGGFLAPGTHSPTLSGPAAVPLSSCWVPAPLNFSRSPPELGRGRPLEVNLPKLNVRRAATPGATHKTGASTAPRPAGATVHTRAPGRAVIALLQAPGAPPAGSGAAPASVPRSGHTLPALCFPKPLRSVTRRPDSRQPRPALRGRFAGRGGR